MSNALRVGTFDLEGDGLLDDVTRIWCGAVKDHATGAVQSFGPGDIPSFLIALGSYDVLIGHNCIGYDFPALRKLYGWEFEGKIVDTLIMSRFQNPSRPNPIGYFGRNPHSVEAWGHRLGRHKQEHEDWSQFSPAMLERCKQDVEIQYELYHALLLEGKGKGWAAAHKLNMKLFYYLQLQEEYGWTLDVEHINRCIRRLDAWVSRIDRVITPRLPSIVEVKESKKAGEYNYVRKPFKKDGTYSEITKRFLSDLLDSGSVVDDGTVCSIVGGPFSRVSFRPISLDSVAETKDFLLAQGWKPAEWNKDQYNRPTTPKLGKDDPFEGIQGSLGRLVAKRIQCRHRKSTLEGWLRAVRPDGRISPKVNGIASTGRLKHSVVVNVPNPESGAFYAKQMRQCFIARPGWVMVGCDSKGNQMRQLAARMQDPEFTHAVLHGTKEEGTDLHSLNMRRAGIEHRSRAKNFFYGCILFGAGDKKTASILETDVPTARAVRQRYFDELPALKRVLASLSEEWRATAQQVYNPKWNKVEYKNGYITGIDGRKILVEFEKDLLAYALQSDEAIQMAAAYVILHKWIEKRGWKRGRDWGMLIWYHDEVQMECRPELAEELGQLACNAIKWAGEFFNIQCPHDGDYSIGNNWYETH